MHNRSILAASLLLALAAPTLRADPGDVVPRPTTVTAKPGQFTLSPHTVICDDDAALDATAKVLVDLVAKPLGATPELKTVAGDAPAGSILLTRKGADAALGDEGYQLAVTPTGVVIRARTDAGLFYGVQTLRQLLPPQIESREAVTGVAWDVPCVDITDSPRCRWRGLMLDVSRHFFDVSEVEQLLDVMALHKLNTFHWHLTDDQGWRIEIKKYPKLTEDGAWRDGIGFGLDPKRSTHYRASDGKYGGFYTQDDIRAVVAYAARLHITIVPEIEMPGHAVAALSVYPQFGSSKQARALTTAAGVVNAVHHAGDDATFGFLDDVLTEVAGLFPGPFIHIGGDEVPKGPWRKSAACQARIKALGLKNEDELQSYFIKRVEGIVASKGKRLIGWDEILEGGLAPGAAVMSWHGVGGAVKAANEGHDVVLSPTSNAYFDYGQTKAKGQPKTIGGYLPLAKVYSFNPAPAGLSPAQVDHVLGAQGNVWTEYMPNLKQVELMAFPRACAMAEVTWTTHDRTDYADFLRRLDGLKRHLAVMGVTYFDVAEPVPAEPIGTWVPSQMGGTPHPIEWDATKAITKPGKYRVTLQYTGGGCRLDAKWVALSADGTELARDTHDGTTGGSDHKNEYVLTIPSITAGAKYTLTAQVRSDGGDDSNGTVTVTPEP
jgi:hexosaminidase